MTHQCKYLMTPSGGTYEMNVIVNGNLSAEVEIYGRKMRDSRESAVLTKVVRQKSVKKPWLTKGIHNACKKKKPNCVKNS